MLHTRRDAGCSNEINFYPQTLHLRFYLSHPGLLTQIACHIYFVGFPCITAYVFQDFLIKYTTKMISIIICIVAVLKPTFSYDLQYEEFLKSTPQDFGILTVTHARDGNFKLFAQFLKQYAQMDCPLMTQISIVWNNDISPQQAGIVNQDSWKRPVHFIKTPFNSMDFRYLLPADSKANVYFSMDDDVEISCQQLNRGFKTWQSYAVGDIGPIVSYERRGFDYMSKSAEYRYSYPLQAQFFTIALVGVAWIPRFYFQLYNTDQNLQISQMREVVREKNNCDDIALNTLVTYFFPEFLLVPISGKVRLESPEVSQSRTKSHETFRSQCIYQFTQIFGVNPLRITSKWPVSIGEDRQQFPLIKQTVYLKRKYLANKYLTNEKGEQLDSDYFVSIFQNAKMEHPEKVYSPETLSMVNYKPTFQGTEQCNDNEKNQQIQRLQKEVNRLKQMIESLTYDGQQRSQQLMMDRLVNMFTLNQPNPVTSSQINVMYFFMGLMALSLIALIVLLLK